MLDLICYKIKEDGSLSPEPNLVQNANKILWSEKYLGLSEVTIEAPIDSDLFRQLPIGTLVSHINTLEIMQIHTHSISGSNIGDPSLKVSGSAFRSVFETWPIKYPEVFKEYPEYTTSEDEPISIGNNEANILRLNDPKALPKHVIFDILNRTTKPQNLRLDMLYLPTVDVDMIQYRSDWYDLVQESDYVSYIDDTNIDIKSKIGDILSNINSEFDIGFLVSRNQKRPGYDGDVYILVHGGTDRTGDNDGSVHFMVGTNTLSKYSSLNSNKTRYNCAVVSTKFFNFIIYDKSVKISRENIYNRHFVEIDASHIDSEYADFEQASLDAQKIVQAANDYATSKLSHLNQEAFIVEVDANKDNPKYEYRIDYNLGDIITIDSSAFFDSQPMRVVEYVESVNDGQFEAYPVIKAVKPGWEIHAHSVADWDEKMKYI